MTFHPPPGFYPTSQKLTSWLRLPKANVMASDISFKQVSIN